MGIKGCIRTHDTGGERRLWRWFGIGVIGLSIIVSSTQTAWADIPNLTIEAEREGCAVRLDLSLWYHHQDPPLCRASLRRKNVQTGKETLIFDDKTDEADFQCESYQYLDAGLVEACTRYCAPIWDFPGPGTFEYIAEAHWWGSINPLRDVSHSLSVPSGCYSKPCATTDCVPGPHCEFSCPSSDDKQDEQKDDDAGCACSSSAGGMGPWLLVLGLMAAGLLSRKLRRSRNSRLGR